MLRAPQVQGGPVPGWAAAGGRGGAAGRRGVQEHGRDCKDLGPGAAAAAGPQVGEELGMNLGDHELQRNMRGAA